MNRVRYPITSGFPVRSPTDKFCRKSYLLSLACEVSIFTNNSSNRKISQLTTKTRGIQMYMYSCTWFTQSMMRLRSVRIGTPTASASSAAVHLWHSSKIVTIQLPLQSLHNQHIQFSQPQHASARPTKHSQEATLWVIDKHNPEI